MTGPRSISLPASIHRADDAIDRWWEPLRESPVAERVFYTASAVGDFSVVWHGLNLARLVWGAADRREFARLAVALGIESIIVNQGLKRLFGRERPTRITGGRRLRTPSTSSFPSGHASSAAMAALLLSERSKAAPLYAVVAVVVATSRLHVRVHHASDVIAGATVGSALGLLIRRVAPLRRR